MEKETKTKSSNHPMVAAMIQNDAARKQMEEEQN